MSRHRNVRSLNYSDECEGFDDVYGHSVEDDYSISPSVEQFMFDRSKQSDMSAYISKDKDGIAEEDEEAEGACEQSLSEQLRPQLNEIDEARLQSCLDEIRNVIGDSTPERVLIDTIVRNGFDIHRSLDAILNSNAVKTPMKGAPAEQREKDSNSKSFIPGLELPPPPAFDLPMACAIDLGAALVPSMSNLLLSNPETDNVGILTSLLPPPPLDLGSLSTDVDLSSALVQTNSLPPPLTLPPAPQIDLSGAIIQPNDEQLSPVKENTRPANLKVKKTAHFYGIDFCDAKQRSDSLIESDFQFVTKNVSNLGVLICRKWTRRNVPVYTDPYPTKRTVAHFRFNCPSPDDKVLRSLNKNFRK